MNDRDELDARVRRLTARYNEPPSEPDVDALWTRIESARKTKHAVRRPRRISPRLRTWLQSASALAAVLLIGIAIGRWSTTESGDPTIATTLPPTETIPTADPPTKGGSVDPRMAHRLVARDYLLRTETLLTEFRLAAMAPQAESGTVGGEPIPYADDLLFETRLLRDSPVAVDTEIDRLLSDLELILAEIVQLSSSADERERAEIQQSLEERGVMLRLRRALPAKVELRGA